MRHAGRCGDSAVAVSPTTSRKVITRLISSGSRTSIGDGGMVANSSLPISQTARIGTSTRPTPSMAAVTVRSRWPGSAASPRPKRRRRKRPPAHSSDGEDGPAGQRRRDRGPVELQAGAQPRAGRRRQRLQRGAELGPELAPDVARQGRGVAAQQRAQHDLAAQLGQALDELVGAGDHHLALLDAALADRRPARSAVRGRPSRRPIRARRRWPAWPPAAPEACACRRGRCGRGWPPPRRRRARRPPARAGRRSRPAAGSPARRGWRCGRVGASTARRAGRTAAAAARRLGQRRAGCDQQQEKPRQADGKAHAGLVIQSRFTTGSAGPSCRASGGQI